MTPQEIKDLIKVLRTKTEANEASWSTGRDTTRYEIEIDGKEHVFARFNNTEKNQQQFCYIKVGDYENEYEPDSEEFTLISEFVKWL
jgi:hypothetical protein